MTLGNPRSGPGTVSEYQVSGLPFATASNVGTSPASRVDFPFITSEVQVRNPGGGGGLRVGFTANGVLGTNYFTVLPSGSWTSDVRIKTLYIASTTGTTNYEVQAALTMVDPREFPVLSGSAATTPASGVFGYNGLG